MTTAAASWLIRALKNPTKNKSFGTFMRNKAVPAGKPKAKAKGGNGIASFLRNGAAGAPWCATARGYKNCSLYSFLVYPT